MKKLIFRFIIFTQLMLLLDVIIILVAPGLLRDLASLVGELLLAPIVKNNINIAFVLLGIYGLCLVYGTLLAGMAWLFCKINKLKLPQESWRILSYAQKLLIAQLFLLISITILLISNTAYQEYIHEVSEEKVFLYIALVVVAGIGASVLWHWADRVKSNNSTKAKILFASSLVVCLLCIAATYFAITRDIESMRALNESGYYEAMSGATTPATEGEQEGEEYEEGYEGEYDGEGGLDVGEWEGPMRNEAFVDSCFKYIIQNERYASVTTYAPGDDLIYIADTGYMAYQQSYRKVDDREKFINSLGMYINRDQDRLMQFYYTFSDVIYKYLPWKEYKSEARNYVKLLLRTYANCNNLDGSEGSTYDALMSEIYNKMIRADYSFATEHYNDIDKILVKHNITEHRTDLELFDEGTVVWAYSFWARRNHEGNYGAAITILNLIDEHYNSIEEELDID